MVVAVVVVVLHSGPRPDLRVQGDPRDRDQDDAGGEQQRQLAGLDVAHVRPGQADLQQRAADEEQQDRLASRPRASQQHRPDRHRDADRRHERGRREPDREPRTRTTPTCIANSFRSTIGPTTRKASRAVSENWLSDAATNASASEQIDSTTASRARASTDNAGFAATVSSQRGGTVTLSAAAANAPMTRNPPACTTSWRHDVQNAAQPRSVWESASRTGRSQPGRPRRSHSHPITDAVSRLATNRASTILGWPGKATAVETSTTGLIAGEASRNANAAAGATPRRISAPATGTDPHSQAGSTAPASPATGTAAAARRGSARSKKRVGTNAVIAADSTVPSMRNGSACTITETKTVTRV